MYSEVKFTKQRYGAPGVLFYNSKQIILISLLPNFFRSNPLGLEFLITCHEVFYLIPRSYLAFPWAVGPSDAAAYPPITALSNKMNVKMGGMVQLRVGVVRWDSLFTVTAYRTAIAIF